MPCPINNENSAEEKASSHKLISKDLKLTVSEYNVFFDFDNTITSFDILDDIIKRFSINRDWMMFEKAWMEGEIGSKDCLENQLRSVRVTREGLLDYLSRIDVDIYFIKLVTFLKGKGIQPVILSDSFSFIIRSILENNSVRGIKVYSNRVRFDKDRLIPSFPYMNTICSRCAHCKQSNMSKHDRNGKKTIYVGDGLSDFCPAREADLVFAKGELLRFLRKTDTRCLPFNNWGDIYEHFNGRQRGR